MQFSSVQRGIAINTFSRFLAFGIFKLPPCLPLYMSLDHIRSLNVIRSLSSLSVCRRQKTFASKRICFAHIELTSIGSRFPAQFTLLSFEQYRSFVLASATVVALNTHLIKMLPRLVPTSSCCGSSLSEYSIGLLARLRLLCCSLASDIARNSGSESSGSQVQIQNAVEKSQR